MIFGEFVHRFYGFLKFSHSFFREGCRLQAHSALRCIRLPFQGGRVTKTLFLPFSFETKAHGGKKFLISQTFHLETLKLFPPNS